jgi:hypothetical protein
MHDAQRTTAAAATAASASVQLPSTKDTCAARTIQARHNKAAGSPGREGGGGGGESELTAAVRPL